MPLIHLPLSIYTLLCRLWKNCKPLSISVKLSRQTYRPVGLHTCMIWSFAESCWTIFVCSESNPSSDPSNPKKSTMSLHRIATLHTTEWRHVNTIRSTVTFDMRLWGPSIYYYTSCPPDVTPWSMHTCIMFGKAAAAAASGRCQPDVVWTLTTIVLLV